MWVPKKVECHEIGDPNVLGTRKYVPQININLKLNSFWTKDILSLKKLVWKIVGPKDLRPKNFLVQNNFGQLEMC